jgi:hypothetical protein
VVSGNVVGYPSANCFFARVKIDGVWNAIQFLTSGEKPQEMNVLLLMVKRKDLNGNSAVLAAPLPFGLEYGTETQMFFCRNIHLSRTAAVLVAILAVEIAAYFGLLSIILF